MKSSELIESIRMLSMNRCIAYITFMLVITSCSNPINKSVTEPLSEKEINKVSKSYEGFDKVYFIVEKSMAKSAAERSKYYDLTYKRLYKYVQEIVMNRDLASSTEKKYGSIWEKQYANYGAKVDSVLNAWRNYERDHGLESYVKIELAEIKKEYSDGAWGGGKILTDMVFLFRITPLRGKLDGLELYYGVHEKGDSPSYSYLETTGRNRIQVNSSFDEPLLVQSYPTLTGDVEYDARELDATSLLEKYKLHTNIYYIDIHGEKLRKHVIFSKIPSCVRDMWNAKDVSMEYARDYLIKEMLDENYVNKQDYIRDGQREEAEKFDKLANDFWYEK